MPAHRSTPPPIGRFPTSGLLPKESTQALAFLKKYPQYDGQNVRVAILDTGVDPAAIGLDGPGKMVDVIDCTGSGDIALTQVKPASTEAAGIKLTSPTTGRTLLLSSTLKNPSDTWWVGTCAAYELWPGDLIKRRKAERKREFDVEQSRLVGRVQQRLYEIEHPSSPGAAADDKVGAAQKLAQEKEDVKAQLAALKELGDSYTDPGPIIEAVVFHDGSHYRTVVGGAEGDVRDAAKGMPASQLEILGKTVIDMANVPALADFRFQHEHAQFGAVDMLTYSVNVLTDDADAEVAYTKPQGKPLALSLVVTSGSHATHVAGIVGAHRTDDEVKNGVAPGCEIVSLKIGDTRLGSMETQQALLRAAQALIATKCECLSEWNMAVRRLPDCSLSCLSICAGDIANMSFGESGAFGVEDKGMFAEMLRDFVVRRRNILFISSAGNNGPALTTVGQPGGTTTSILSIGAYVDAGAMQEAEYALVEQGVPSSATTWCSRGPAADGAKGVDVYAPGAAITSIPRYCLQATMMANGTSMSSPNACGSIALLLSAMKYEKIPITAARVYKAIRATGKSVDDDLGTPFIQVDKAWNYLVDNKDKPDQDAEFVTSITPAGKPLDNGGTNVRGIYIRERPATHTTTQYNVTVKPKFGGYGEQEEAYALQIPVTLVATEDWIQTPNYVFLGGNGRTFETRVDTSKLEPGLHSAFVEGYDSDSPGRKLFDIPVTVAKPIIPQGPTVHFKDMHLSKGCVDRRFISVPQAATWAEIKLRSSKHQVPGASVRCWVHGVQLEPHRRLPNAEHVYVLALNEDEPVTKKIQVRGGMTMELCLAQFFTNASAFNLDVDVDFHGINVSRLVSGRDELTLIGGEGVARLECVSNLRIETLKPTVSFDQRRTFVRPSSSFIRPLAGARDLLPNGQQMSELQATYSFELKEDKNAVKLSLPLTDHLYDSSVPMLSQLYDVTKKRVAFGDVYAKTLEKLERGSYTLIVQVLNDSMQVLEALRNMTLRVDQKLSKPLDVVELYEDHVDQFGSAKPSGALKDGKIKLMPGERKILCLNTNLEGDKVPKEAAAGDLLLGTLSFMGPNDKSPLRYLVPPPIHKSSGSDEAADKGADDKPKVAELMASLVPKVPESEKNSYVAKLVKEYPDDLNVLMAKLESLKADDKASTSDVIAAADAILKHTDVDEDAILIYIGSKLLPTSEQTREEKQQYKRLDKGKSALKLALNRKCRALLASSSDARDASSSPSSSSSSTEFEATFARYRRLADAGSDKEFATVYASWSVLHGRYGAALQAARKVIKDVGAGTSQTIKDKQRALEQSREMLARLDWQLWVAIADRQRVLDASKGYQDF